MDTPTLRRITALLASVVVLASLTVAAVAAPASAQVPTCDGKPATIVGGGLIEGTDGDDVIVGSDGDDFIEAGDGNDTICAGKGNDAVDGGPMRDRIFGGSGDDVIVGGGGGDDIFGYGGNDRLLGQGGNDFINGGTGTDDCRQGAGSGAIKQCEKADLQVRVFGPSSAVEGTVTFKVRVRNLGPNATPYTYQLDEENESATCNGPQPWETIHVFDKLRPGAARTRKYSVTCTVNEVGAWVRAKAYMLDPAARDPRLSNNKAVKRTSLTK